MTRVTWLRLAWRSGPNEGEVELASEVEIRGKYLWAHLASGALLYTNDPDLVIEVEQER